MYKKEYEFYYEQAFNQTAFELTGNTKHLFRIDEKKKINNRMQQRIERLKQLGKWEGYGRPN